MWAAPFPTFNAARKNPARGARRTGRGYRRGRARRRGRSPATAVGRGEGGRIVPATAAAVEKAGHATPGGGTGKYPAPDPDIRSSIASAPVNPIATRRTIGASGFDAKRSADHRDGRPGDARRPEDRPEQDVPEDRTRGDRLEKGGGYRQRAEEGDGRGAYRLLHPPRGARFPPPLPLSVPPDGRNSR